MEPCALGLPELLKVAHMTGISMCDVFVGDRKCDVWKLSKACRSILMPFLVFNIMPEFPETLKYQKKQVVNFELANEAS